MTAIHNPKTMLKTLEKTKIYYQCHENGVCKNGFDGF
jgi:hypothetical protein